ncbi:peptidylprolyl isomerase [Thermithiobacillus tepidarius DSM 3134]|uniref:peptidylprolyl isomerase n=1 Tax=Thermithiobacillus tepidarius TaxID=929 RepID=UPI0004199A43|nr:peptidylprolyl isomerase [Thermithiobacillus tepidarius]
MPLLSRNRLLRTLCLSLGLGASLAGAAQAAEPFVDRNTRIAPADGPAPAAAAAVPAAAPTPSASAASARPLDRVVAVVNKDIITDTELEDRVAIIADRLRAQNPGQQLPMDVLRRQVLDRMILERIQLQLAERTGIRVDEGAVDQAVENIARQNNLSVEQLRGALEQQGKSFAQFRQELKDQIILSRLARREVEGRVTVSADEENTFVKQAGQQWGNTYDLQHILVIIPENASPAQVAEKQARAEAIRARLLQGADFDQTAITESDGQNALQGGRMGVKRAGELPPDFVKALDAMQVGQISPVLRSSGGFHIFKLLDKKAGQPTVPEIHARHILIQARTPAQLAQAQQEIASIERQLRAGKDFATLAREYSQDPGSAAKGGDLGWVAPGQMVPEFESALFALKPGEISGPVRSAFGLHLIQALEVREKEISDKDIKQAARNQIFNRKSQERMEQWLRELREEAYVKIMDPTLQGR